MKPAQRPPRPACSADPELWFDKVQPKHALLACLGCPMRQWCAGEALRVQASFGMWAGIFIDNNLASVTALLRDIAQSPAPTESVTASPNCHRVAAPGAATPPPTPRAPRRVNAVLSLISARSSGHCEIMTQHCRLTFDTLGSRVPGRDPWTLERAGDAYAVCRPCAAALADAEPAFVERLGIVVRPPYEPAYTRFFWRQTRWVYLDGGSRICPADDQIIRKAL
ncbi:WhiB family transcriptional regulator [Mycobacterium lehmannii]|uniref:WhiB family transcriptional regulator n=1 Tax=Mycobacterium lehmannii TaxID=2048550 RepID=UPI000B9431A1